MPNPQRPRPTYPQSPAPAIQDYTNRYIHSRNTPSFRHPSPLSLRRFVAPPCNIRATPLLRDFKAARGALIDAVAEVMRWVIMQRPLLHDAAILVIGHWSFVICSPWGAGAVSALHGPSVFPAALRIF